MLYDLLISFSLINPPVQTIKEAEGRYGALNSEYEMINKKEWIVKFTLPGTSYETWLNKDIIIPLSFIFKELELTGLIKEITDFKGCYSSRAVRGKQVPSIHAYGLGCDFNHSKFSEGFVNVWKKYGFIWGGDFCSWKDYMHFSYAWEVPGDCEKIKNNTEKTLVPRIPTDK